MPDLSAPLGDCIKPPCLSLGQILEGAAYFVVVLVIVLVILAILTRVLGGRVAPGAPAYESKPGAYALGGWVTAALERLPRPWRDETFYEQLQADRATVVGAGLTVLATVLVLLAPGALWDVSAGRALQGIQRLVVGSAAALVAWLVSTMVAVGVARLIFRRRPHWPVVLAGLGFAASPLVLVVLSSLPVLGLLVLFVAASWSLFLCFIAIRATVGSDEVQSFGITLSIVLATFATWTFVQFSL